MDFDEKILGALKKAAEYLQAAIETLDKSDETSFSNNIWHISAELEYVLFLLSLKFQEEYSSLKFKQNPKFNEDVKQILLDVSDMLGQAQKCVEKRELQDAYKSVYFARHYISKIQVNIARKQREAYKKK